MQTERFGKTRGREAGLRKRRAGWIALLLCGVLLAPAWALAQGQGRGRGGTQGAGPQGQGGRGRMMGPNRGMRGRHQGFFMRLRDLPPKEQEQVMSDDPRFQSLPPERQERIREHLKRWNVLSPEQKQSIRQRERVFEGLSPAQRREVRSIYPDWNRLDRERKQEVMQTFRHMRAMTPEERDKYLHSPDVEKKFSPDERRVLQGLNDLLPGSSLDSMDESED